MPNQDNTQEDQLLPNTEYPDAAGLGQQDIYQPDPIQQAQEQKQDQQLSYPHGNQVHDPYRQLDPYQEPQSKQYQYDQPGPQDLYQAAKQYERGQQNSLQNAPQPDPAWQEQFQLGLDEEGQQHPELKPLKPFQLHPDEPPAPPNLQEPQVKLNPSEEGKQ